MDFLKQVDMNLMIKQVLAFSLVISIGYPAEASWLLPINGQLKARIPLIGNVSNKADTPFQQRLSNLLDAALDNDPKSKELDRAVNKYRTPKERFIANSKDGLDWMIPYRGFGPSKEAGNAVLDENIKIKSRSAAEYLRQKNIDEKHLLIVTIVMQIAAGMGMEDRARGDAIVIDAVSTLKKVAGEEEAKKTVDLLCEWQENLKVPDEIYNQQTWDVFQTNSKYKDILIRSLDDDPVIRQIIKNIHRYNKKGKFAMASASIIETALGAGALVPSFIGPACKLALLTFIMSTGGPEGCKVMKELYLDKRLESRFNVYNEETHLALENYQLGLLTKNPLLLALSESIITELVGVDDTKKLLGNSVFKE